MPSTSREHFAALVAMQAFRAGAVADGSGLLAVIENPGIGREVHLVIASAKTVEGALVLEIRVVDGTSARGVRWREIGRFAMTVSSQAVSITAAEQSAF